RLCQFFGLAKGVGKPSGNRNASGCGSRFLVAHEATMACIELADHFGGDSSFIAADALILPGDLAATFRLRLAGHFLDLGGTTTGAPGNYQVGDGILRGSSPVAQPGISWASYLLVAPELPYPHV